MKRIFKYSINVTDSQMVSLPVDAEIICVQTQNEQPCIWAVVDDEITVKEDRLFEMYGTGHIIRDVANGLCRKYAGTFQLQGGGLVFHLFELCENQ